MARRMKYDVESKEEATEGEVGFLSRWSTRKSQIAKGEDVPDELSARKTVEDNAVEDEEDATLTDSELLEKYDLPDPEAVTEEGGLEQFLNGKGLPGRVRQMALRRLWRLNPLFGVVDDMVEYGEDYTDAATVIEGMKTAYTVGKGYEKEVVVPEESETLEDDPEATNDDAEANRGDAEAKDGEKDGEQDEKVRTDEPVDQSNQTTASETRENSDADTRLAEQNDAETAVAQDELSKLLGENQIVLEEFGVNHAEINGAAPASAGKSAAHMKALQEPAADHARTQVAANGEEKTDLNQPSAWRPTRMDFRKR